MPAQRMPESSRAPGKCQGNHSSKAVIICYLSLLFVGCLITVQDGNIWGKDNFLYQNSRLHWFKAAIRVWELSLRGVSLSSNSTFYIFLPLSRNFFRKVSSLEKTCYCQTSQNSTYVPFFSLSPAIPKLPGLIFHADTLGTRWERSVFMSETQAKKQNHEPSYVFVVRDVFKNTNFVDGSGFVSSPTF